MQIEFKSFNNLKKRYQFQYRGTFNEAMNEITGTREDLVGKRATETFAARRN